MNDNFEINDWVKITMKNKSVICGQVTALGKKLVDGEEHDFYQVRVLDDRETTVFDVQMVAIEKVYTQDELGELVIEIADKHGINVETQSDSNNKLADSIWGITGHWKELSEDERKVVCEYFGNPKWCTVIIEMANAFYSAYMGALGELQEIVEKQAEKEKAEQDKGIAGFMEKYYPRSDNSPLSGYGLSGYGGETSWQPINH